MDAPTLATIPASKACVAWVGTKSPNKLMADKNPKKENTGAWVIHHGRKLVLDSEGAAEYPAIDRAAKAATLLAKLGDTSESNVSRHAVKAIAIDTGGSRLQTITRTG